MAVLRLRETRTNEEDSVPGGFLIRILSLYIERLNRYYHYICLALSIKTLRDINFQNL